MAKAGRKVGRNTVCSCGSGRKAKRCCGVPSGPGPDDVARAELAGLARRLAPVLAVHDDRLGELLDQVTELPCVDLSLSWPLPRVFPPELEALRAAVGADDLESVKAALPAVVAAFDSQVGRARLAHAVVALESAGRLEAAVAAAAVFDLASGSPQLVTASIVEAVLIDLGATATPSGLLLAGM